MQAWGNVFPQNCPGIDFTLNVKDSMLKQKKPFSCTTLESGKAEEDIKGDCFVSTSALVHIYISCERRCGPDWFWFR